jgi:hypothetical protein
MAQSATRTNEMRDNSYESEAPLFANSQTVSSLPHDYSGTEAFLRNTHTTTPLNPLGVKGIGEVAPIGAMPAIVMLPSPCP